MTSTATGAFVARGTRVFAVKEHHPCRSAVVRMQATRHNLFCAPAKVLFKVITAGFSLRANVRV
jgi:hypothetical protein